MCSGILADSIAGVINVCVKGSLKWALSVGPFLQTRQLLWGAFSSFLALITFSTTQPQCTGILLVMDGASTTEQDSSRPTTSHVQGSSKVLHLSGWSVRFSVILPTAFQIFPHQPPPHPPTPNLLHLLGLAAACTIFNMRKPVAFKTG